LDFSKFDTPAVLWRIKLKVGQKIDILKHDIKYDMSMWSEGEIEAISYGDVDEKDPSINLVKSELDGATVPKDLKVKFINDVGVPSKSIRADSDDIKILGAKTYDEAWRLTLGKGDAIDVLDKDGIWRESTCLAKEERETYSMPLVQVGHRKYHEKGEK
jgi:hypothetical protein